ncbi:MAG TPA: hypothetical protein VKB50_01095, partial [Vicinamibacterales bacterium]|nr:hypothetical protein [Vicinamibacterales bacterium]
MSVVSLTGDRTWATRRRCGCGLAPIPTPTRKRARWGPRGSPPRKNGSSARVLTLPATADPDPR